MRAESPRAEIVVLSTLHQLHEEVEGYDYDDLAALIEKLNPDVLAVELTRQDLDSRRDQRVKQEYQRAVFPLLDRHGYEVLPLEPEQPRYDDIVALVRAAQLELTTRHPELADVLSDYTDTLYARMREHWTSACAVNSVATDRLFESKHRFQNAILGPMEEEGWERWNRHFLERIVEAAASNPGKRIVVLVGAEHAYWLRAQLARETDGLRDVLELIGCDTVCELTRSFDPAVPGN